MERREVEEEEVVEVGVEVEVEGNRGSARQALIASPFSSSLPLFLFYLCFFSLFLSFLF